MGAASFNGGPVVPVMLTPVPEPSDAILLGVGLAGLGGRIALRRLRGRAGADLP